ncbi:hypothetical protein IV203_022586 [Nitzschia inconspicua]|uniref:Uncharacterized protein n=1 Tax=Nitzschia inconspicua TaxID=303405 RepID=A0A9K3PEL9_9STRA|nr:hypothetical protein IV203_022586 [Nitzschia inconspicua]
MIRNSYPTIQATARRCLIRSLPNQTTKILLPPSIEAATRRISVVPSSFVNNAGSSSDTFVSSWTPPELYLTPKECSLALKQHKLKQQHKLIKQQQQWGSRRSFVWHAGLVEQAEVEALETAIQSHMSLLAAMIQQLPAVNRECSNNISSTPLVCQEETMKRILQQEELILQLGQEYKRLTGEDYEALPKPNCDESSTVLPMMDYTT